ncbi:MAG: metallophosphoesterase family protein [Desulfobulbales bacterium]
MPTKIGLISDVHATPGPVRDALSIFRKEGVDLILCAGDVAGYGKKLEHTVELLIENHCTAILGNHDVWLLDSPVQGQEKRVDAFFKQMPSMWKSTIAGKSIYAVHASPPRSMSKGIALLDQDELIVPGRKEQWSKELEEFTSDVLIVGHTHQVFAEKLGSTLVINPGSTKFNHTCAILSLPDMKVRIFPLSNKVPRKFWRRGMISGTG